MPSNRVFHALLAISSARWSRRHPPAGSQSGQPFCAHHVPQKVHLVVALGHGMSCNGSGSAGTLIYSPSVASTHAITPHSLNSTHRGSSRSRCCWNSSVQWVLRKVTLLQFDSNQLSPVVSSQRNTYAKHHDRVQQERHDVVSPSIALLKSFSLSFALAPDTPGCSRSKHIVVLLRSGTHHLHIHLHHTNQAHRLKAVWCPGHALKSIGVCTLSSKDIHGDFSTNVAKRHC